MKPLSDDIALFSESHTVPPWWKRWFYYRPQILWQRIKYKFVTPSWLAEFPMNDD